MPDTTEHSAKVAKKDFIENHWKPLTLVGIIILIVGSAVLLHSQFTTGSFMARDIELTGGKQIEMSLDSSPDIENIKAALPDASISLISGIKQTLVVETSVDANETEILNKLSEIGISGEHSIRTIGPLLGDLFWRQTQIAIIAAFILMSIVVFILFRTPVPSLAIVLCAITDAVFALAVLSLIGERLSLAVLAGTLMLIGYSVDTDIVLTTELLKSHSKEIPARFRAAAKTGLTLTIVAIAALATMYFISTSSVIREIAIVLILGLACDIPSTWLTNGGILRWYLEKREKGAIHD